ncbi:GNAT family N-acetyltransferase [Thioclava sp. SK-1]|uniref:GNAT family N-acetyltransferase n=1 Tax=Thioclava sp. SK-1 TaxID=1889770 RepID=UPI0008264069|nr:GNAT family N-acetyltransferase [Thioclava sp. SK-1]OCX61171.1 GNAT family N-acetyltransferase [Thioclava sp. SK-1]
MAPQIRPAHLADLPCILQIIDAAYAPYIVRMGQKPGPMLDDYAALIRSNTIEVLDDDGACGILVLLPQKDAMLLDNVAIAPDAQGKGYGKQLMCHAENAARDAGFDRIRLYTNEVMVENLAIYARLGYHETHRVTEKGLNRVYMEKPL